MKLQRESVALAVTLTPRDSVRLGATPSFTRPPRRGWQSGRSVRPPVSLRQGGVPFWSDPVDKWVFRATSSPVFWPAL